MPQWRFGVGAAVMCNLGASGWKPGRVIALDYREDHWPEDQIAPYQVLLDEEHALIYVPEDDPAYCRQPTQEDSRIAGRSDALAALPSSQRRAETSAADAIESRTPLRSGQDARAAAGAGYRDGRCHGCDCCPQNWSSVELYSEHYRCAERCGLKVTRRTMDLGDVRVGDSIDFAATGVPVESGFLQCPTLVRLPPGVRFADDGSLAGVVQFDPHREEEYRVEFVAVSTVAWQDSAVGLVRLEIAFDVAGNESPDDFDGKTFARQQEQARQTAAEALQRLGEIWQQWELDELGNEATCERMWAELGRIRQVLQQHPRLDAGQWWAQLGGYHMNVHKLLENALLECELYLGHALTFGDPRTRWMAEQNLDGCYQKRLLEAARYLWIDAVQQMLHGDWASAAETLQRAAAKHDGWGWAVNFGDIWFTESVARLIHGAQLSLDAVNGQAAQGREWINAAAQLLDRAVARTDEARFFGPEGHPWAGEIAAGLADCRRLQATGGDLSGWLSEFQVRTVYWCGQILAGAFPFPPQPRPRREDAAQLRQRLPGHNKGL